jgi:glutamate-ammonia-ligase adenylyltransferase
MTTDSWAVRYRAGQFRMSPRRGEAATSEMSWREKLAECEAETDESSFIDRLSALKGELFGAFVASDRENPDIDRTLSSFWEFENALLEAAFERARREVEGRHGVARLKARGGVTACRAAVLRLDAGLNDGRTLALLFVYESDAGASDGARGLGHSVDLHTFHCRLFSRMVGLLDGSRGRRVFDLDTSMRPEGHLGAICNSLPGLEAYYERFGEVRSRFALARAQAVLGDSEFGREVLDALRPFVYRRGLDSGLAREVSALRAVLGQRSEARTVCGSLERLAHATRALQLLHGARRPRLAWRGPREALRELVDSDLLTAHEGELLLEAEGYLRRHSLYLDFQDNVPDTHANLQTNESEALVASAIDLLDEGALSLLPPMPSVEEAREEVTQNADIAALLNPALSTELRQAALKRMGFVDTELALSRLAQLARHPDSPFHPSRDSEFASKLLVAVAKVSDPDQALGEVESLIRQLRSRPAALAQLASDDKRLNILVHIFGANRFVSRLLVHGPGLLDRLLLEGREPISRGRPEIERLLDAELRQATGFDEVVAIARRFFRAELVRVAFHHLAGHIESPEPQLTALAEAMVGTLAREAAKACGLESTCLIVLAGGALGADAQGYDSPLELIILVEEDVPPPLRARLGRSLSSALSAPHEDGGFFRLSRSTFLLEPVAQVSRWFEAAAHRPREDLSALRFITGSEQRRAAFESMRDKLNAR